MARKGTTKYQSNKQEKKVAKEIGGRTTVASGALDFQKADVRSDILLVEAKTTANTYYSLTLKTWEKIKEQALRDNMRVPIMNIQLRDGKNSIAVLSWNDFIALELDKHQFVGNPLPDLVDAKSYRVTPQFLYDDFSQQYEGIYYKRHDIKFVDEQLHLVMLDWTDFISMLNQVANL